MMTPAADHADGEDKRIIQRGQIATLDIPNRGMTIINESGMCFIVLGRRNLTDAQKTYLIGRQYEAQKMTIGNHNRKERDAAGRFYSVWPQNGAIRSKQRTRDVIAADLGVSSNTVERAGAFSRGVDAAEKIESGARDAILPGKSKVPKSVISELPKMPKRQF